MSEQLTTWHWEDTINEQKAEIARLRATLKAARPYVEYCAEASKAAAAALREIDAMAAVRDGG